LTIEELRGKIDAIDQKLLALLNERAQCAVEIGHLKHSTQSEIYVPDREKSIYDALRAQNTGPLSDSAIKSIYREIMSATKALERMPSVAFLGPKDTFSHMAALRIFGSMADYHPVASVPDVFTEVERKRVDYGVVPVETSMGGRVEDTSGDTLDQFLSSNVKIVNEVMVHITHSLLANCPIDKIKRVYSKSQPFVQCRNWLLANVPHAEQVEVSSTAEAARIAAEEPGAAAVASAKAAETYKLGILATGIEDVPHNYTRFFVIGRGTTKPTGHDKTAVMFSLKDRPGALYHLLKPLADAGVNLTRIESRPSKKKAWEYVFFIDMLGHIEDDTVRQALDAIAHHCIDFKILGSFPHGEVEE